MFAEVRNRRHAAGKAAAESDTTRNHICTDIPPVHRARHAAELYFQQPAEPGTQVYAGICGRFFEAAARQKSLYE